MVQATAPSRSDFFRLAEFGDDNLTSVNSLRLQPNTDSPAKVEIGKTGRGSTIRAIEECLVLSKQKGATMISFQNAIAMFSGVCALSLVPVAAEAADYQVYRDAVCTPNTQCGINFAKVPSGKLLRIDNTSCYVRIPPTVSLGAVQLVVVNANGSRAMAITPDVHFQDDPRVEGAINSVYVGNATVRVVVRPTQFIRIYAQTQNNSDGSVGTVNQMACHISGTLE
jgi:hypothetical protein